MIAGLAALSLKAAPPEIDPAVVTQLDTAVESYMSKQLTDPASRWRGGLADATGIYNPISGSGQIETYTAAFLHPRSKFYKQQRLVERIGLAADFLVRSQSPEGFISLLVTNFNSPPDTAFAVAPVATAALLARRYGAPDIEKLLEPFLRKAGHGMAHGGVHTPNHRWITSASLAQINELYPDPAYVKRIDAWLAESIDIDADGQYTERSTGVYNVVCDRAFCVLAAKLKRPKLLDAVRRNLESMLYLMHPDFEVVTEISRRQDQYQKADMGIYWFPLQYMAVHTNDGRWSNLARRFSPQRVSAAVLMEYPELNVPGPDPAPLPDNFEKRFDSLNAVRIRRGAASATLVHGPSGHFFALRRGGVVINSVRFASAFFGKGQFVPTAIDKQSGKYELKQELEAGYYQPIVPPIEVKAGDWSNVRFKRQRSEICKLEQRATITEIPNGFRLRVEAKGTADVPLAVEINLRDGVEVSGCVPSPVNPNALLLKHGYAVLKSGGDQIRVGPGVGEHAYTTVRGAEPPLPGRSVYLCAMTPFDHTITFEW